MVIGYPPPPGSRGSDGALIVHASYCDGLRAWLSVIVKLWNERREYATSAETRGSTSCCTPMLHCQSWSRAPHPRSVSSLTCVILPERPPKFRLLPVSPAHSALAVRMARLHSTIRSPSSVQPLDTELTVRTAGLFLV